MHGRLSDSDMGRYPSQGAVGFTSHSLSAISRCGREFYAVRAVHRSGGADPGDRCFVLEWSFRVTCSTARHSAPRHRTPVPRPPLTSPLRVPGDKTADGSQLGERGA